MINVALFGFGRIGQMHAENLNKNKEIKLLYVYEKIDQLSKKAKKLNIAYLELKMNMLKIMKPVKFKNDREKQECYFQVKVVVSQLHLLI